MKKKGRQKVKNLIAPDFSDKPDDIFYQSNQVNQVRN